MCRLVYLPANVARDKSILTQWFEQLNRSFGGDGIGWATMRHGAVKGVTLTPEESAEAIARLRAPVVWHTRRVSCGIKSDALCHPHKTRYGWLVHNGHWHTGAFAVRVLHGEWSDTAVAALHVKVYGWRATTAHLTSGVWLHLVKGGCAVCYRSGDLWVETRTGSLASEPCPRWGDWTKAEPGVYDTNESVTPERKVETTGTWFPSIERDDAAGNWLATRPTNPYQFEHNSRRRR